MFKIQAQFYPFRPRRPHSQPLNIFMQPGSSSKDSLFPFAVSGLYRAPSPQYLGEMALALPQDSTGNTATAGSKQGDRRQRGSRREVGDPHGLVAPPSCECPLGVARRQRAHTNVIPRHSCDQSVHIKPGIRTGLLQCKKI